VWIIALQGGGWSINVAMPTFGQSRWGKHTLRDAKMSAIKFIDDDIARNPPKKRDNDDLPEALTRFDDLEAPPEVQRIVDKYSDRINIVVHPYDYHGEQMIKVTYLQAHRDTPKGTGTAFMEELSRLADRCGYWLGVSPGALPGDTGHYAGKPVQWVKTSSRNRLLDFYKRFGFVSSYGRRNYRPDMPCSMFRRPAGQPAHTMLKTHHQALPEATMRIKWEKLSPVVYDAKVIGADGWYYINITQYDDDHLWSWFIELHQGGKIFIAGNGADETLPQAKREALKMLRSNQRETDLERPEQDLPESADFCPVWRRSTHRSATKGEMYAQLRKNGRHFTLFVYPEVRRVEVLSLDGKIVRHIPSPLPPYRWMAFDAMLGDIGHGGAASMGEAKDIALRMLRSHYNATYLYLPAAEQDLPESLLD
jgi:hypothetical protein